MLDAGDPERAVGFRAEASSETAEQHRLNAAATVDAVVSLALETLPDDGVLMLVSTGQVKPAAGPSGYGPIIVAGPGYEAGLLESSSTHRPGLITDLDVSATVLAALGVDRPVEILGNAASSSPSDEFLDDRVTYLQGMNDTAVAVDTVRPAVQSTYIALTVIILIVCAALLRPMERALAGWGGRAARLFSVVILLLLAMPVSATLMYLFVRRPDSAFAVGGLFAMTTLVVWVLVLGIARRWGSAQALATMGLLTAGTLLLDQLFGAPLSFSGLFSYSPLLGARYYGLGNEGASIIVGAGLVGLALVVDAFQDRAWIRVVRMWGPPLVGALVVVRLGRTVPGGEYRRDRVGHRGLRHPVGAAERAPDHMEDRPCDARRDRASSSRASRSTSRWAVLARKHILDVHGRARQRVASPSCGRSWRARPRRTGACCAPRTGRS